MSVGFLIADTDPVTTVARLTPIIYQAIVNRPMLIPEVSRCVNRSCPPFQMSNSKFLVSIILWLLNPSELPHIYGPAEHQPHPTLQSQEGTSLPSHTPLPRSHKRPPVSFVYLPLSPDFGPSHPAKTRATSHSFPTKFSLLYTHSLGPSFINWGCGLVV